MAATILLKESAWHSVQMLKLHELVISYLRVYTKFIQVWSYDI